MEHRDVLLIHRTMIVCEYSRISNVTKRVMNSNESYSIDGSKSIIAPIFYKFDKIFFFLYKTCSYNYLVEICVKEKFKYK